MTSCDDCLYLVGNVSSDVRANILCNRRYGVTVGAVLRDAKAALKVIAELTPSRLTGSCSPPAACGREPLLFFRPHRGHLLPHGTLCMSSDGVLGGIGSGTAGGSGGNSDNGSWRAPAVAGHAQAQ